ncbi:hypothetical protein ABVT39_027058 [Epinephelus coioides]
MQVYTGKPQGGRPEKNQGMQVVLDLTRGLSGRNVTCDNFFTSYDLGQRLLRRGLTMVGTVRKNKPELPPALLATRERAVFSCRFAFMHTTLAVSYLPKRSKNVVLLSTLHTVPKVSDQPDGKPSVILCYNANKGSVDNLDSCQLPEDDRSLAQGRVPQHARRVLLQLVCDMEGGQPPTGCRASGTGGECSWRSWARHLSPRSYNVGNACPTRRQQLRS